MKAFRILTAFLLLTAMGLSTLPDGVLDYFHTHEHAHDCHPDNNASAQLEKEHIHCKHPQLYFRDADLPAALPCIVLTGYAVRHACMPVGLPVKTAEGGKGRAPPALG